MLQVARLAPKLLQEAAEPVADFLKPDVLARQRMGDADPVALPTDSAVATHESGLEVPGVFDARQLPRELPRRRAIGRVRGLLTEPFVRPLFVVLAPELVEADLLGVQVAARRPRGLGLQGAVHALVPTVLLGMRGLDELGTDPEADPPHRKRRQSSEGRGGERHAVVGADDAWQAVLFEEALEDRLCEVNGGGAEPLAREQVTAVTVDDGQGVADRGFGTGP